MMESIQDSPEAGIGCTLVRFPSRTVVGDLGGTARAVQRKAIASGNMRDVPHLARNPILLLQFISQRSCVEARRSHHVALRHDRDDANSVCHLDRADGIHHSESYR